MKLNKKLINVSVLENDTLKSALKKIDENGLGVCFVTKKNGILKGVISDGDIRRAIIKGHDTQVSLVNIIHDNYVYLKYGVTDLEIQKHLSSKIKYIPLIDNSGYLIDYASNLKFHNIPMACPILDGNELSYVSDCIKTNWISSQGTYVKDFEESFASYIKVNRAITTANGTAALHLALRTLRIGPGDEVLVPNLTFISPINAVLYVGAKPIFIDIDKNSLCINPKLAENAINEKTKAIIPVHLYGQAAEMDKIVKIAKSHKLFIIEDCAEALGTYYNNAHVGTFGDASIFSFFGNKTITTGEGGMLIFNSKEHDKKARILRDHAMDPKRRYWHNDLGYNYRLTNIQAAIGLAQLEKIEYFINQKKNIANQYEERFINQTYFEIPNQVTNSQHSFWVYTIILNKNIINKRDKIINEMLKYGVETRPTFYAVDSMPYYQSIDSYKINRPVSNEIAKAGISLPTFPSLDITQIKYISESLLKIISKLK
jgi:perosamine synthetase